MKYQAEETEDKPIKLPARGWTLELAEICGVSQTTIINAIHHHHPSEKCKAIRKKYRELYM